MCEISYKKFVLQKKQKICLVSDCLALGGAEKVAADLSFFFDKNGFEVHHIIVQNKIEYLFAGQLLNLGKLKNQSNNILNKLERLIVFNNFIKNQNFDYIIDFRVKNSFWQELAISKFIYQTKTIYAIHSFMLDLYFPKNKHLATLIFKNKSIIAISTAIKSSIGEAFNLKNVAVIHNLIDLQFIKKNSEIPCNISYDYIVLAGTFNNNKQFDKIIECYSKSILPSKNIKLILLGNGENKLNLEKLVEQLDLKDKVIFKGRVQNPYTYYARAKFLVLASKFEGLPMVLIECLACGTPVISFDCKSGPNEIINNNNNGLLVENQNFEELTVAINKLIDDTELYAKCKSNAAPSIEKFDLHNIGQQWLDFFKTL